MDKKTLEAKLKDLETQRKQAEAQLRRLEGAIIFAKELLAEPSENN